MTKQLLTHACGIVGEPVIICKAPVKKAHITRRHDNIFGKIIVASYYFGG